MQTRAIQLFGMLPRIMAGMLAVIAMWWCTAAAAQPATGDTSAHAGADSADITSGSGRPADPSLITTFEQLDMPIEMIMSFNQLTPKGILLYHDEFQSTHDGVNGLEIMVIKVWYIDDHIIGYVIKNPLEAPGAKVSKCKIDIPVTWLCRPTIQGHEEHAAHSLAELRTDETSYKCSGWHLELPPPLPPETGYRLQNVKKSKRELKQENESGDGTLQADSKTKKGKKKKVGFDQQP